MKKFTLIVAFIAIATITFGQAIGVKGVKNLSDEKVKTEQVSAERGGPVWSVDFSESPAVWTIGSDQGTTDWIVDDTIATSPITYENGVDFGPDPDLAPGTLVPAPWLYMGWRFVADYSTSGGEFAYIDGISLLLQGSPELSNSWVQVDGIDLSAVNAPKLSMVQNYKAFNSDACYLDISIDGGSTWTNVQINTGLNANDYGDEDYEMILTSYCANQPNVSLRFRWQSTDADPSYGGGYGWQIDDLAITENAQTDMKLVDARMNFFEYIDYTQAGAGDYFHISSHYGFIPQAQFANDSADMWFNGIVENKGALSNTVDFQVKVLDPNDVEIYNQTVTSATLASAQIDTVDVTATAFELTAAAEPGVYTVAYSANIASDENPMDNADTTYFVVSDQEEWARDLNNPVLDLSPANWSSGGSDGEMVATDYLFMYESTVETMAIYIGENTDAGTSLVGHLQEYNTATDTWDDFMTTPLTTITAQDIDNWLFIDFPVPAQVMFSSGTRKNVKAAVEFYYGGQELSIGYDPTVPVSFWGAQWYMLSGSSANSWVSYTNWEDGGIAIRLDPAIIDVENNEASAEVNVYPNPTSGVLNIENANGKDVEIFNLVGQKVYSQFNADNNMNIDLSNLSEGTYVVRISGNGSVETQKINIVK